MSSSPRIRTALLPTVVALALTATPAMALAPVNAAGTDVAAADQQAPRSGRAVPGSRPPSVTGIGRVALRAPDQQAPPTSAPRSGRVDLRAPDQQAPPTAVNARGTDVAAPDQQSPRVPATPI